MNDKTRKAETAPEEAVTGEVMEDEVGTETETTLASLALTPKTAGGIVKTKAIDQALKELRQYSIGATYPEDWVLFKRPDDTVTGFLSDAGCKRISDYWRISTMPPGGASDFVVEKQDLGDDYLIVIRGDAINHVTGQMIYGLEGARGSDEDFVKNVHGTRKLAYVRKAAFANLYGTAIRKLSGLDSIPLSELQRVWEPLGRNWQNCPKGKGFGGSASRYGDAKAAGQGVAVGPSCPLCGGEMKFIKKEPSKADPRKWAFWGCKQGKDKCKGTIEEKKWNEELAKRKADDSSEEKREPGDDDQDDNNTIGENVGEEKNRLLTRIKGKPWEPETKKMILQAKSTDELLDILTTIVDHERGAAQ